MTQVKLIHKSRAYADRIMEKINEDHIRDMVFKCWVEAYQAGFEAAMKLPPQTEDMGR